MFHDHVYQPSVLTKELIKYSFKKRPYIHLVHNWLEFDAKGRQCRLKVARFFAEHGTVEFVQGL